VLYAVSSCLSNELAPTMCIVGIYFDCIRLLRIIYMVHVEIYNNLIAAIYFKYIQNVQIYYRISR